MSEIGLARESTGAPPRASWYRLSTLAVVSLLVVSLRVVGFTEALSLRGFVGLVLEGIFVVLPVLAAIAVGLLQLGDRKRIAAVIAGVTLAMLVLDFAPGHAGPAATRAIELSPQGTALEAVAPPRWPEPGAMERVVRCEAGGGCLERFRDEAGRVQREGIAYAMAYFKLFFLLAPAIVITTSAAVRRWVEGAFLFLDDSAEWLVTTLSVWILPLAMLFLVNLFASQAFLRILAHGWPAVALAYPYLGLLVLSGLSWQYLGREDARG